MLVANGSVQIFILKRYSVYNHSLEKPITAHRLVALSLHEPAVYCNDSGSMSLENRFAKQRHLVSRVARYRHDCRSVEPRCTKAQITKQSLDINFFDGRLANVQPRGMTLFDIVLR